MMSNLKEDRIKMLSELLDKIMEVSTLYQKASPAWILIHSAWGHVNSVQFLEKKQFDEKTLGVKSE